MNEIIRESISIAMKYGSLKNLMREYQIQVKYFYGDELGIEAFNSIVNGHNLLFINDKLDEYDKNVVVAHEIGHIIFHDELSRCFSNNLSIVKNNKEETQANIFATIFLKLGYSDNYTKTQKIINYIYCTYLNNSIDYHNYINSCDEDDFYLDYDEID